MHMYIYMCTVGMTCRQATPLCIVPVPWAVLTPWQLYCTMRPISPLSLPQTDTHLHILRYMYLYIYIYVCVYTVHVGISACKKVSATKLPLVLFCGNYIEV